MSEVNSFGYHWFCKPFWLVIWDEVILLGFHLMVLHSDVAFAVEVVLDFTKGWRNVWLNPKVSPFLCLLGLSVLILSPGWWRNQLSHLMTRDRFSIRWSVESARCLTGGKHLKHCFWVFSPVSWVIWMFWFLDLKRSMKIDFIWTCETRNWLLKSGNRVSETKLYVSHVASRFSQDVNWS